MVGSTPVVGGSAVAGVELLGGVVTKGAVGEETGLATQAQITRNKQAGRLRIVDTVRAELEAALGPEATWVSVDGKPRRGFQTMIDSTWWPNAGDSAPVKLLIDAAESDDVDEEAIAQALVAALPPSLAEAIANEVVRRLGNNQ